MAAVGWSGIAKKVVVGLATIKLVAPPWCLRKILLADLARYRTPEARGTLFLASKLYQLDVAAAAQLLKCEQIDGLLEVAVPHIIGSSSEQRPHIDRGAANQTAALRYSHIIIFLWQNGFDTS